MTPERAHEIAEVYRIRRADAFVAHVGTQGGIPLPTKNWWEEAILAACYEERHAALTDAAGIPKQAAARLMDGRSRVNQVDRHVADILSRQGDAILALRDAG